MQPWMWTGLWWICLFAAGFYGGILYKGRKFKPIIAVIKNKDLSKEDKAKQIIDLMT